MQIFLTHERCSRLQYYVDFLQHERCSRLHVLCIFFCQHEQCSRLQVFCRFFTNTNDARDYKYYRRTSGNVCVVQLATPLLKSEGERETFVLCFASLTTREQSNCDMTPADALPAAARDYSADPASAHIMDSAVPVVATLVEAFDHLRHETEAAIKRFPPKIAELAEGVMEEITKMETSKYRDDIQHRLRPARFGRTRADSAAYEPLPDLPRLVVEDKPVLRLYFFGVCRRMNRDEVLRLIKPFAAPPSSTVTRPKHPPVPRDGKKKKSVTSWCHINCADLLTSLHLQGEYCGVVPQCFAAPPVGARHAGPLSRYQPLRRAAQRETVRLYPNAELSTRACLAAPIARQCRAENKYSKIYISFSSIIFDFLPACSSPCLACPSPRGRQNAQSCDECVDSSPPKLQQGVIHGVNYIYLFPHPLALSSVGFLASKKPSSQRKRVRCGAAAYLLKRGR
ncbi:unnamed protein product, partial [Trichogramma brassicae]